MIGAIPSSGSFRIDGSLFQWSALSLAASWCGLVLECELASCPGGGLSGSFPTNLDKLAHVGLLSIRLQPGLGRSAWQSMASLLTS